MKLQNYLIVLEFLLSIFDSKHFFILLYLKWFRFPIFYFRKPEINYLINRKRQQKTGMPQIYIFTISGKPECYNFRIFYLFRETGMPPKLYFYLFRKPEINNWYLKNRNIKNMQVITISIGKILHVVTSNTHIRR